jgi:hypothetical protein
VTVPLPAPVMLEPGVQGAAPARWSILRDSAIAAPKHECDQCEVNGLISQLPPDGPKLLRSAAERPELLRALAVEIVIHGADKILPTAPSLELGKLFTLDRREIESYRAIQTLILEYSRQPRPPRPLSIAIFGPPGAGKSFGVKQVADSVLGDRAKMHTFNLSQFGGPHDLIDALHQVRDASLSGKLPLVFWDEFDSRHGGEDLAWLHHFLVPMQDGEFQDGQVPHPIGPAIFVFAGGTCSTMQEFGSAVSMPERRAAKGPDFVSRLKGYVNVTGPEPEGGEPFRDPLFVIRRAILLRSVLLRDQKGLIEHPGNDEKVEQIRIDRGVARAFLTIDRYRHGSRSLESIIAMSQLAGRHQFDRSCLPGPAQLDVHVDGEQFEWLMRRPVLMGDVADDIAQEVHKSYCNALEANGYRYGETSNVQERISSSLVCWDKLSPGAKQQNRDLVAQIPAMLRMIGCEVVRAHDGILDHVLDEEDAEILAEREHFRWVHEHLRNGTRWGTVRDDERRRHPALLPWRKPPHQHGARFPFTEAELARLGPDALPEHERMKDRAFAQAIPRILEKFRYTVVKTLPRRAPDPEPALWTHG